MTSKWGVSAVRSPFQKKCYIKHRKQVSSVCVFSVKQPRNIPAQMNKWMQMDQWIGLESDISGLIFFYSTNTAFRLHPSSFADWDDNSKTFKKGFLPCRWNAEKTRPELPGASLNDVASPSWQTTLETNPVVIGSAASLIQKPVQTAAQKLQVPGIFPSF